MYYMDNPSLAQYTSDSKNVCMYTTISIILILIFVISPMNTFIMTSIFSKLIIIIILGYTLYKNYTITTMFSGTNMMNGPWTSIKTNMTCSYLFSLFILLLLLSVFRSLF